MKIFPCQEQRIEKEGEIREPERNWCDPADISPRSDGKGTVWTISCMKTGVQP
jgi:hypothetical protein